MSDATPTMPATTPLNHSKSLGCSFKKSPLGGFLSTTTTTEESSLSAAREAVRLLTELGVADPLEVMRVGALAMVRRSIAAAEGNGPRYLRTVVVNGGPWSDRDSASAMLRDIELARETRVA